jgi:uncharacterized protein (DUF488 family)
VKASPRPDTILSTPMILFTVGYEGRSPLQLVSLLKEHGVERLVDVRDRPYSRRKGFSAVALFELLRKEGITYEWAQELGNPDEIRAMWKNGELDKGRREYRKLLQNGRRAHVRKLVDLTGIDRLAILCLEAEHEVCHRSIIAEESVAIRPDLDVRHI